MNAKIIEHDKYGQEKIIIEHHEHGRIYAEMRRHSDGDVFSWAQGVAVKIKPGDTLQTISGMVDEIINDYGTDAHVAMINGYDDERPVLAWPGYMIEKMICSAQA